MDDRAVESAAEVFDGMGAEYERAFRDLPGQLAALDWLTARLPAGARVLDVGSGTGRPVAETLVRAGYEVTGIDVSAAMVELARAQVPAARFERRDVRDYRAPDGGFDAVCAFFPLLVMGRDEVGEALRRITECLVPGGYFVMATVPADIADVEIEWMGHRVRVSSYSTAEYLRRLREDCGLEVLYHATSTFRPDSDLAEPEDHLFCYARRSGAQSA
ncbi:methyltransferase domain-containing protein [Streptomyces sp. NBC_00047]|uniref:class I SAM-dependent methyltransferase n=1 Tax=Streptomyces sp. NBC_00047 TaxID=2975627 RepID=UPI0022532C78|nr:class I SAM-dependent methyltransferase [Streptomyces sp. NBC_00047]MCX5610276.1 methyltransferase domain-containing protein [Streptomyces sp. NBC_00047]